MKIVVLDAFCTNPGDLPWTPIEKLGEVTLYDRTSRNETVERLKEADAALTNKSPLTAEMLRQLPKLKYIGILATGTNIVDLNAAHEQGITVTNIPGYSTTSVAQMTFALLLSICNHAEHYAELNRTGYWSRCDDFCYWDSRQIELAGKQMGIIGMGSIGKQVAAIAMAMGMRVATCSSKPQSELPAGVEKIDMPTLLATSDVLSLHCPLTADNRHMLNAERIAQMKQGAILINTARGPLVDENALADALNSGHLYGAGLDVMEHEPPREDNPLLKARNCIITPHIAWATEDARRRLLDIAADNLAAFLNGNPVNTV